jgi:hypothetical protein
MPLQPTVDDKIHFIRKWFKKCTPVEMSLRQKWNWYKKQENPPRFFAGPEPLTMNELRQIILTEE